MLEEEKRGSKMDLSHLDKKYFLDERRYNCPFCNRGSVSYKILGSYSFDWSKNKTAYCYLIKCGEGECEKVSMHMSYFRWDARQYTNARFDQEPDNWNPKNGTYDIKKLDTFFFFHQPTTFFTLDARINKELRDLIAEAEGCLKMNYLVGASACTRKAIYVLIDLENSRVLNEGGKTLYRDSIMSLKTKFGWVHPEYFDALARVQELSSDNVHEGSWEAWDGPKVRILLELTKNVLHEIYVVPDEQKQRANVAGKLLGLFKAEKATDKSVVPASAAANKPAEG